MVGLSAGKRVPRLWIQIAGTSLLQIMDAIFSVIALPSRSKPSHDDIARCARELWIDAGRPSGRDDAIWLEAERRLTSIRGAPATPTLAAPALSRRRFLRLPL
jgi:hypothetical protein